MEETRDTRETRDTLRVRLSRPGAVPPRRSGEAAGFDLAACEAVNIPPWERRAVHTGVHVQIPPGTYARVAPRSGLALSHGLDVLAGVVDGDYRGEVRVILMNLGGRAVSIAAGDRVAQLILERVCTPPVEVVRSLDETARGSGGFGSTGA